MGEVKSSFPLIWASSPCTDAISFLFIQIERDRRTSRRPRCRSALGPRAGMLAPNAVQRRQAKRESPKRRRQYRQEHLRWCGEGHRQSLFSLPFFTLTRFGLRQLLARSTAIRNAWKARQAQHQQRGKYENLTHRRGPFLLILLPAHRQSAQTSLGGHCTDCRVIFPWRELQEPQRAGPLTGQAAITPGCRAAAHRPSL